MLIRVNLTGGNYVNQHVGFSASDVAVGNPASNASFTTTWRGLARGGYG